MNREVQENGEGGEGKLKKLLLLKHGLFLSYELKVLSQFPSFKKEGCPKGGVVGEERKPYSYDS